MVVDPSERADVAAFLAERHGAPVTGLERLGGGHWSTAWGYRTADGRELVVRFGEMRDGWVADRDAHAYASADLPVPEVIEIGERHAISERHHGRFLEDVRPDEVERARPMLVGLLGALRAVAPTAGGPSWRRWLLDALVDDPSRTTRGWRATLPDDVAEVFELAADEVSALVALVPERRDLVHSDLLHGNVLVSDDASIVTAIFSWKCSTRGDWLYDVAWCSFWSAWHPGIGAVDVWSHVDLTGEDPDGVARRRRCYELQIGASHIGWYAWTGEEQELRRCAERTAALLEPATRRRP